MATNCYQCGEKPDRDTLALNKKLLGRTVNKFLCIKCLAEYLGATTDDLLTKIEELKEQGCDLFK